MSGLVLLLLSPLVGKVHAQSEVGVVQGIVRDTLGNPIPAAVVAVVGTEKLTYTDDRGRFQIRDVPFGEIDFRVRRLGYRPFISTVVFPTGTRPDVEFRIVPIPDVLAAVEIIGQHQVYDARLAGFRERSTKGVGHFVTRERLDRMISHRFTDVLREIPSIRTKSIRGGGSTIQLRGANCPPLVFVDGFPAQAGVVDLDMFDVATVEGIEVYSGFSSIPAQFITGKGTERCGVVAIWSRPYRPKAALVDPRLTRSRELDSLVAAMSTYDVGDVDMPASLIPGSATPEYPDSLRANHVSGRVVVEVVVNPDGTLDREAVTLISSTHPSLTAAVLEALVSARFRVATLQGRGVRQVLQVPFVFRPEESASRR